MTTATDTEKRFRLREGVSVVVLAPAFRDYVHWCRRNGISVFEVTYLGDRFQLNKFRTNKIVEIVKVTGWEANREYGRDFMFALRDSYPIDNPEALEQ